MSHWWRAYDECLHDPKLVGLSDPLHRAWFNLLCIASKNCGFLPPLEIVAIELRVTKLKAELIISALIASKLLDRNDANGLIEPHNWSNRQYKSDVSTERVKRFRKRKRNVSETPPDTDTDTDTDKNKKERETRAVARGTRLEKDWWPNIEDCHYAEAKGLSGGRLSTEAEKFRNYWIAKAGKDAAKIDWHATWQNWVMRAMESKNGHASGRHASGRQLQDDRLSVGKAAERLGDLPSFELPARPSLVPGTSAPDRRLLPKG